MKTTGAGNFCTAALVLALALATTLVKAADVGHAEIRLTPNPLWLGLRLV